MEQAKVLKSNLASYAASLGFSGFGVSAAEAMPDNSARLEAWLAQGFEGEMSYMRREPQRRANPQEHLPGAKSVIVMAMPYGQSMSSRETTMELEEPRVSRYTAGRDYHLRIRKLLDAFVRYLRVLEPSAECRTFIDTGPLLERALAQRAGIGFVGKNTLVITRDSGSWVFLASVVTTLAIAPDIPDARHCGSCRLCLDACPTDAFKGPFELDARKCISYLTIEYDGVIAPALREKMQGWVFGCDVCQEVCPHNHRKFPMAEREKFLDLGELLDLTDLEFERQFDGTAFKRAGRESLVRNACIAAANLGRRDLLSRLETLAPSDPSPIVREHAAWARDVLKGLPENH